MCAYFKYSFYLILIQNSSYFIAFIEMIITIGLGLFKIFTCTTILFENPIEKCSKNILFLIEVAILYDGPFF